VEESGLTYRTNLSEAVTCGSSFDIPYRVVQASARPDNSVTAPANRAGESPNLMGCPDIISSRDSGFETSPVPTRN